jgi:3-oxoacyl-[acyl-carrier protein] reductase
MELNLADKKVLVTGASSGIGLALAKAFSAEGCHVASNARSESALLDSISGQANCCGVPGDVTDPKQAKLVVDEAIEKLGGLDIVVCNVGSGASVPPGEESYEEWQRVFALNFFSTTNIVEAAKSALLESKGVIVCVSSICGSEVVPGAPVTYTAAKTALNAYIKGISRPLGKGGIRIVGVAPGNIMFSGSGWERRLSQDPAATQAMLDRDVSLSKFGTAEEVGSMVVWCSSERCSFATGSIWVLDGGQVRS